MLELGVSIKLGIFNVGARASRNIAARVMKQCQEEGFEYPSNLKIAHRLGNVKEEDEGGGRSPPPHPSVLLAQPGKEKPSEEDDPMGRSSEEGGGPAPPPLSQNLEHTPRSMMKSRRQGARLPVGREI